VAHNGQALEGLISF